MGVTLCAVLFAVQAAAQDPRATTDTAFRMAQTVQTTAAGQALQQIALRLALKADGMEVLAIERRDLTERLAGLRADQTLDAATRRARLQELDTALIVNTRALEANFDGYRDIIAPEPLGLGEAQALLQPGEALIQMHQGPKALTLWLVTPDHVVWHQAVLTRADAADLVAAFRQGMGLGGTLRAAAALSDEPSEAPAQPFNTFLAANLYQILFAPFQDILAGLDHVMIVADGAWIGLPFVALLTNPADGDLEATDEMLQQASWMGFGQAITMLPSTVSLRTARAGASGQGTTLLAVGDPVFAGDKSPDAALRSAGGVRLSDLVPLPGTRREVSAIAANFDAPDVLLGAAATEAAIRGADLSETDIIVFATHGLIAGELQGLDEPALALTPPATPSEADDGLLKAGEIAGLTLTADWVILSACNTAAGDGAGAEGLSGLARAFFAAGAQTLLVSHWPVRDDAAARLTAHAFAEIKEDPALGKAEAMRRAMVALAQDRSDPTLAHPTAWAPFFVVGG
ncbi:MAG: CHAT domain-containing protein [Pseudomonadota bacterium]